MQPVSEHQNEPTPKIIYIFLSNFFTVNLHTYREITQLHCDIHDVIQQIFTIGWFLEHLIKDQMKINPQMKFNDHWREKAFKGNSSKKKKNHLKFVDGIIAVLWGRPKSLSRSKQHMRIRLKLLLAVCSRLSSPLKKQSKPDGLSSGFDTKRTPAPQTLKLVLIRSLSHTHSFKGQDLFDDDGGCNDDEEHWDTAFLLFLTLYLPAFFCSSTSPE